MEKLKGDIKLLRNLLDRARENPDILVTNDPDTPMTLMESDRGRNAIVLS